MTEPQERNTEELLHWAIFEGATRTSQKDSSREIMRRVAERVEKRIDEIFAEGRVKSSK